MSTQAPVPKDAPLMVAWEAFMQTEDYTNCLRWLNRKEGSPSNGEGELWAAFCAGWNAAGGEPAFGGDEGTDRDEGRTRAVHLLESAAKVSKDVYVVDRIQEALREIRAEPSGDEARIRELREYLRQADGPRQREGMEVARRELEALTGGPVDLLGEPSGDVGEEEVFACPNCEIAGVSVDGDGLCVTCGVDTAVYRLAARLRRTPENRAAEARRLLWAEAEVHDPSDPDRAYDILVHEEIMRAGHRMESGGYIEAFAPSHFVDTWGPNPGWIIGFTQEPDDAEEWVKVRIYQADPEAERIAALKRVATAAPHSMNRAPVATPPIGDEEASDG
mgnify:CR=1 FL=1